MCRGNPDKFQNLFFVLRSMSSIFVKYANPKCLEWQMKYSENMSALAANLHFSKLLETLLIS